MEALEDYRGGGGEGEATRERGGEEVPWTGDLHVGDLKGGDLVDLGDSGDRDLSELISCRAAEAAGRESGGRGGRGWREGCCKIPAEWNTGG